MNETTFYSTMTCYVPFWDKFHDPFYFISFPIRDWLKSNPPLWLGNENIVLLLNISSISSLKKYKTSLENVSNHRNHKENQKSYKCVSINIHFYKKNSIKI